MRSRSRGCGATRAEDTCPKSPGAYTWLPSDVWLSTKKHLMFNPPIESTGSYRVPTCYASTSIYTLTIFPNGCGRFLNISFPRASFPYGSQTELLVMFASLSKAAALAVLVEVASAAAISSVTDSSIAGQSTSHVFPPAHSRQYTKYDGDV